MSVESRRAARARAKARNTAKGSGGAAGAGIGSLWDWFSNFWNFRNESGVDYMNPYVGGGSAPASTAYDQGPLIFQYPNHQPIPAFTGYDITNMLRGTMPREMAEIQLSSVSDQAQGGHSNLLDAITAIQQRNFEQYGQPTSYRSVQPDSSGRYIDPLRNNANRNVPQNPAVALNRPQYNNVATDYYSNRNNYLPGITGLLGGM